MKWLITGGCGFIGARLIEFLVRSGHDGIRIVDNLSASRPDAVAALCHLDELVPSTVPPMISAGKVELVVGDIQNADLALRAAQGADTVVHLAASTGVIPSIERPRFDCDSNVIGTLNYLEAARSAGCKSFVFASSGAALGAHLPPLHEELAPHPVSPYGASKLSGEAYCQAYYGSFGLHTVALRFANVYGPGSGHKQSVVAKFIKRALNGEPLVIHGDGQQTRDFIYVEDLVGAVFKAASSGLGGEIFQVATCHETTVLEMAALLVQMLREATPIEPTLQHGEIVKGEVRRNFADVSKAARLLGWTPRTDLREGLQRTVAWFLQHPTGE